MPSHQPPFGTTAANPHFTAKAETFIAAKRWIPAQLQIDAAK
jgi:hypothetical protein